MTPLTFTLRRPDGDIDVTATPTDPPDRSVGILAWTFDLTAERDGQPYELAGQTYDAACWQAQALMTERRYDD